VQRRARARERILRTTAILPSLFTLGNGLLGFASIYLVLRQGIGLVTPGTLTLAVLMLFGAMVCDMLDGRIARFTRRTSDFGGQLDSLCDAISFGAAPGVLMIAAVMLVIHRLGDIGPVAGLGPLGLERTLWCIAGAYMSCAILRLARFNVENEPDESAHMSFKGLPSPGAAAVVASLILLFVHLDESSAAAPSSWLLAPAVRAIAPGFQVAVAIFLPVATLLAGLLMVSTIRYSHLVNHYIRGRRPFAYLVRLMVILLAVLLEPHVALASATVAYAFGTPLKAAWGRLGRKPPGPERQAGSPGAAPPQPVGPGAKSSGEPPNSP
jgi:CDP-diacylglycerol--serine O-phosphatidyltransferase